MSRAKDRQEAETRLKIALKALPGAAEKREKIRSIAISLSHGYMGRFRGKLIRHDATDSEARDKLDEFAKKAAALQKCIAAGFPVKAFLAFESRNSLDGLNDLLSDLVRDARDGRAWLKDEPNEPMRGKKKTRTANQVAEKALSVFRELAEEEPTFYYSSTNKSTPAGNFHPFLKELFDMFGVDGDPAYFANLYCNKLPKRTGSQDKPEQES